MELKITSSPSMFAFPTAIDFAVPAAIELPEITAPVTWRILKYINWKKDLTIFLRSIKYKYSEIYNTMKMQAKQGRIKGFRQALSLQRLFGSISLLLVSLKNDEFQTLLKHLIT